MAFYFICYPCHMPFFKHGVPNRNENFPEIIAKILYGNR